MRKTDFYIDGKWVAPVVAKEISVINPADEQPFATISLGSAADVDKAVAAAQRAFPAWSSTSREHRLVLLEKLLVAYKRRMRDMANAISWEMGVENAQIEDDVIAQFEVADEFAFISYHFHRPPKNRLSSTVAKSWLPLHYRIGPVRVAPRPPRSAP